jgi:NitT/TauT family transport system permease protein
MDAAMKREALRMAMPWLVMAVLLVVWEICCVAFDVPEIILPRPTKVFAVFWQRLDILLIFCWETLWTTVIGFLIAIAGGMLLGVAVGASPFVYSGLYPLLIAFNAVPKVAIVPILMIWVASVPAGGDHRLRDQLLPSWSMSHRACTINPKCSTCCAVSAPRPEY